MLDARGDVGVVGCGTDNVDPDTGATVSRKISSFGGRADAILEKPSKTSIENARILRDKGFKIIGSSKIFLIIKSQKRTDEFAKCFLR